MLCAKRCPRTNLHMLQQLLLLQRVLVRVHADGVCRPGRELRRRVLAGAQAQGAGAACRRHRCSAAVPQPPRLLGRRPAPGSAPAGTEMQNG